MTRQITLSNDAITEGQETAVLSLNNGGASSSLIINDTSVYPDIKNTDISSHIVKFRTDIYTSPTGNRQEQLRLMAAMSDYGSTRNFRTARS